MDTISLSLKIQEKIAESEMIRAVIRERITESAKATSEYDKSLAKVIVQLLAGIEFDIDGVKTGKVKATNADKVAKGICWKERLAMDTAEGLLKSAMKNLDSVASEMNAWQSINRNLSEV